MHIDMHWWDFTANSFRRISAIENIYSYALMGPKHKTFSWIFSYQEYLLTSFGGSWTPDRFDDLQLSRILIGMHWWDLNKNLFGNFELSRILIDMHWWDLNTESSQQFSDIKNTYWHALVGPWHKILSAYFSYQENLLTCIDRTLTQFFFSDWQRSKILMDMHWWDLKPKFFQRFSANKNTYEHALVEP